MTEPARQDGARPRAAVGGASQPARPPRTRAAHPLLAPFPLAVMALSTFLVVFTLMMARMSAGTRTSLSANVPAALVAASGGTRLRTSASGGSAATAATTATATVTGAGGPSAAVAVPAVLTRSSGARAGGTDD